MGGLLLVLSALCRLEKRPGSARSAVEKYWLPVDLYVGGAEHAVLASALCPLLHKVLLDIGVVSTKEPFQKHV